MFGKKNGKLSKEVNKSEVTGYSARIKLPNGTILVASETGLRDVKTFPSKIVLNSKEQAKLVATNLARAYGKGAKPSISIIKKEVKRSKKK